MLHVCVCVCVVVCVTLIQNVKMRLDLSSSCRRCTEVVSVCMVDLLVRAGLAPWPGLIISPAGVTGIIDTVLPGWQAPPALEWRLSTFGRCKTLLDLDS